MAGANSIYGSGMLELGQTFSMEQLVMDNEIIKMNMKVLQGLPVTDETLAVDAIKEVGVGRDFLGHPSTMEHFESASNPTILNRMMLNEWIDNGSKNAIEVAHEIVEDVMANHVVKPIEEDKLKAMEEVVKKADEAFKNKNQ